MDHYQPKPELVVDDPPLVEEGRKREKELAELEGADEPLVEERDERQRHRVRVGEEVPHVDAPLLENTHVVHELPLDAVCLLEVVVAQVGADRHTREEQKVERLPLQVLQEDVAVVQVSGAVEQVQLPRVGGGQV